MNEEEVEVEVEGEEGENNTPECSYDIDSGLPYDTQKRQSIITFFKKKSRKSSGRNKDVYTINENGDLITSDIKGTTLSTIILQYYRAYSKDEFESLEKERIEKIIELENKIDEQKKLLREAETDEEEFNRNSELTHLEKCKSTIINPYAVVKRVKYLERRDVNLEEKEEKRKAKEVYQFVRRDFTLWNMYGKYTQFKEVLESSEQKGIRLEPGEVFLNNGRVARFFNENDLNNEFLSVFLVRDFVYNDTKFSSPYQAFEVTRLMELNKEDLATKVLGTRSIKQIRYFVRELREAFDETKAVWEEIFEEFYKQHPDLIKELIKTKDCILAFANTNPYLGGIGLTIEDERRLDTSLWKSNVVGEVLMRLRSNFMQEIIQEEAQDGGKVTKSVITEEEMEANKKGSIINAMKKRSI